MLFNFRLLKTVKIHSFNSFKLKLISSDFSDSNLNHHCIFSYILKSACCAVKRICRFLSCLHQSNEISCRICTIFRLVEIILLLHFKLPFFCNTFQIFIHFDAITHNCSPVYLIGNNADRNELFTLKNAQT